MEAKKDKEEKIAQLAEKYNINLQSLEKEQEKLSRSLSIKDSINFELVNRIAGIECIFARNKIISAIIVISDNFEMLEQDYFIGKASFPYIPGFRAYRELPAMLEALNKLEEKPDAVFIRGHGILHPRKLGIASHFSIAADIPAVGIADSLIIGEIEGENILVNKKVAGKILELKTGARPVYISPGNLISPESAKKLVLKFTKKHKIPEPLRLARKYAREISEEQV